MKKAFAIILTLALLVAALAVPAMAEESAAQNKLPLANHPKTGYNPPTGCEGPETRESLSERADGGRRAAGACLSQPGAAANPRRIIPVNGC